MKWFPVEEKEAKAILKTRIVGRGAAKERIALLDSFMKSGQMMGQLDVEDLTDEQKRRLSGSITQSAKHYGYNCRGMVRGGKVYLVRNKK